MSLHFILDGYNIIKRLPSMADKSLQDGRAALISLVNVRNPQGSIANKVTIVFDGNADVFGGQDGGIAKVVFATTTNADEAIKEMVEASLDPGQCVVVSDDKALFLYVRALGAKVISVQDFVAMNNKRKSKNETPWGSQKNISYKDAARINEELKRLWLKDK